MMRCTRVLDSTKFKKAQLSRSRRDLHPHCVGENTVDKKLHTIIAGHPSILWPCKCECAACGRACSDSVGLVDFVVLRKIFPDVFRDPHSLDVCALSQTLPLPA